MSGGAAETEMSTAPRTKRHIVVAEDDPNILRQLEYTLQTNGYQVVTAQTGVEALKKLMSAKPDLLITDIMMPEMDGYELASSVRGDEQLADLPIIMLTARSQDDDVTLGYNSGTDLYLTKPFNPTELIAFVQRILG